MKNVILATLIGCVVGFVMGCFCPSRDCAYLGANTASADIDRTAASDVYPLSRWRDHTGDNLQEKLIKLIERGSRKEYPFTIRAIVLSGGSAPIQAASRTGMPRAAMIRFVSSIEKRPK